MPRLPSLLNTVTGDAHEMVQTWVCIGGNIALASATIQAADVTITVNGKVSPNRAQFPPPMPRLISAIFIFQSDVCRGGIGLA